MDLLTEESPMTTAIKVSQQQKTRSDVKLTPSKLETIERCLKLRMTHRDISVITAINPATIAAIKLTLAWLGRL